MSHWKGAAFASGVLAFLAAMAQAAAPIPVKMVVIANFENGRDSGDKPGEFQFWVERDASQLRSKLKWSAGVVCVSLLTYFSLAHFLINPELAGKNIDLSQTYTNEFVKKANAKYK